MIALRNQRVIVPFVSELNIQVPVFAGDSIRYENTFSYQSSGATRKITLPWTPVAADWLEVYANDVRVINPVVQSQSGGYRHEVYDVVGADVLFYADESRSLKFVCDSKMCPSMDTAYHIDVTNPQGSNAVDLRPGDLYAATNCTPVVIMQPQNGYARLSDDQRSILYVPKSGFKGGDSFSYTLMTQHGQIGVPKCIYIKVGA